MSSAPFSPSARADSSQPYKRRLKRLRTLVAVLLLFSGLLTSIYAALSLYIAAQLTQIPANPVKQTPASLGLTYRDISFPSRYDHVQIQGWLIPGVLPNGHLTLQRTIIVVHGSSGNRADPSVGILTFSGDLAYHGFAVLSIDLRGHAASPPAPLSLGYFEQRDVLGAVDFLRSGSLPYPQLGRPKHIAGWGVSMGAATLLLAAAHEPAIQAIVSDCAYADIIPIVEREIPKQGHLPAAFTPGALLAGQVLYGMDLYTIRPVDIVASIAPRPIFFIHGGSDEYVPLSNIYQLAAAARKAPGAQVQTWVVPGAGHARSFLTEGKVYVNRVVDFYTKALGPDTSTA